MMVITKYVKSLVIGVTGSLFPDQAPKVIYYHDIGRIYTPMGTPQDLFWCHMDLLRAGDVVAFDDGFRGIWDVRAMLRRRGIRPLVFIAVRLVGKPCYLTWFEIRELERDYGFLFQCHTWSHQTLAGPMIDESPKAGRSEEWYRHELLDSRRQLECQLGRTVEELCFPAGYFSLDVIRLCKQYGYRKVYASFPGNITDDYVQPRCLVQNLSAKDVKWVLGGAMNCFAKRYRRLHEFD